MENHLEVALFGIIPDVIVMLVNRCIVFFVKVNWSKFSHESMSLTRSIPNDHVATQQQMPNRCSHDIQQDMSGFFERHEGEPSAQNAHQQDQADAEKQVAH